MAWNRQYCCRVKKNGYIKIQNHKLKITSEGKAWIIDVSRSFFTANNIDFTQPQYDILDMFEGHRDSYSKDVIDE